MSQKPVVASYVDWKPAISAQDVFSSTVSFSFLSTDGEGSLFWVELRPEEKGRCVLMMRTTGGEIRELLPAPYSARSRVMEYGGMPYVAGHGRIVFANFTDQRLYGLSLDQPGDPQPLTPERNADGRMMKFMQPVISPDGRWLVAAYELEGGSDEPMNSLCVLDLNRDGLQEPRILVSGADFYKQPTFSPDGTSLAWLQWDHPFMPWNSTILQAVPFAEGNAVADKIQTVAGSTTVAVNDFAFSPEGELRFIMDTKNASPDSPENFFNLYTWRDGVVHPLTRKTQEISLVTHARNRILAMTFVDGASALTWIDDVTGELSTLESPFAAVSKPVSLGDCIATVGTPADRPAQLALIKLNGEVEILCEASESDLDPDDVSRAQPVSFPTEDGGTCHGYYYPPKNRCYQAPDGELPPVRVLVHGGPTGMTRPGFSRENAFWTSQGYAIFDVNYRGSLGFGRAYRDALLGQWGVLEINDVRDGLKYLRKQGLIGDKAVVSGGSAGGYTVQRLLTHFPDLFATGASHFGIGNLVTLQNLTHKFESRYLEGLLGGPMTTHRHVFEERSPINHLENLKSPMIIFQGSEDRVVPPENSREVAEILARKKIMHEYHEYEGEGHGFRQKINLVDSLEKEAGFFLKVLQRK
ncbi:MAG: prolyl oligopeptidase family serine peptidase [Candidatus Riflebacteria bacterium]|nr:prolyl oligopeptidase family serine peptidase [Candidatus Riflebacteria bacterium]